jgi:hypothetical protein
MALCDALLKLIESIPGRISWNLIDREISSEMAQNRTSDHPCEDTSDPFSSNDPVSFHTWSLSRQALNLCRIFQDNLPDRLPCLDLPDRGFALPRLARLCFGRMADYPMKLRRQV